MLHVPICYMCLYVTFAYMLHLPICYICLYVTISAVIYFWCNSIKTKSFAVKLLQKNPVLEKKVCI